MLGEFPPSPSPSFLELKKGEKTSLFSIAACVIAFHFLGTWLSLSWSPTPPKKELRGHVIVKTVQLTPSFQPLAMAELSAEAVPLFSLTPPLSTPEKVQEREKEVFPEKGASAPSLPLQEETPLPLPPPAPTPSAVKETPSPPPPPPSSKIEEKKSEAKPDIKKVAPKPKSNVVAPEPKKIVPTKKPPDPAPVKKPAEPVVKKPVNADAAKIVAEEAEKKRQKELLAAKEAEKLRQREIAAAQEVARLRQQELLNKAKENLAKMGETRDKINVGSSTKLDGTPVPRAIESLQIDTLPIGGEVSMELSAKEISYRDEVAYRLKQALRLPDYGAIKIKLTLDKAGKVYQVAIVSSESQKNKQYIERTLPTLLFLPFGNQFNGASHYTFLITLNNDY